MKHVVFDCDGTLLDTSQPKYKLFPGIKELVVELSTSCSLYVWTARDRRSTLRILGELDIAHYFLGFSTCDDHPPKPHISGLMDLVGEFPRTSTCVIGDSSGDMLGARAYGVLALGATWNAQVRPQALVDSGATFIVNHPSLCSNLIQQNLKDV